MSRSAAVLANLVILGALVCAFVLLAASPDAYYRAVQEDQALEWTSFLAFLVAAACFTCAAWRQWKVAGKLPWFLFGVGAFCFFVAGEEISWAQRVFAYRPPAYFLEHNFQQELNLHNIVANDYRKLAVKVVLLGYGVALALIGLAPQLRRWLRMAAVEAPPAALAPSFLAAYITYELYPLEFSGEWVELMMGFGFLFAGMAAASAFAAGPAPGAARRVELSRLAAVTGAVLLVGFALAGATVMTRRANPEIVEAARSEARALANDFAALRRPCQGKRSINKRVYSYVDKYEETDLFEGSFALLVTQGLPEERAKFFLDPWNSPFWVRCTRKDGRTFGYVYSFGPDRKRDSSESEIGGDDIGAPIVDE